MSSGTGDGTGGVTAAGIAAAAAAAAGLGGPSGFGSTVGSQGNPGLGGGLGVGLGGTGNNGGTVGFGVGPGAQGNVGGPSPGGFGGDAGAVGVSGVDGGQGQGGLSGYGVAGVNAPGPSNSNSIGFSGVPGSTNAAAATMGLGNTGVLGGLGNAAPVGQVSVSDLAAPKSQLRAGHGQGSNAAQGIFGTGNTSPAFNAQLASQLGVQVNNQDQSILAHIAHLASSLNSKGQGQASVVAALNHAVDELHAQQAVNVVSQISPNQHAQLASQLAATQAPPSGQFGYPGVGQPGTPLGGQVASSGGVAGGSAPGPSGPSPATHTPGPPSMFGQNVNPAVVQAIQHALAHATGTGNSGQRTFGTNNRGQVG